MDKCATEAYLGITCHYITDDLDMQSFTMPLQDRHTASNIAELLEQVVARFEIPLSKIIAIVHDNGANIVSAANILEEKHGWSSVRCTGHTLQLVINTASKHPSIEKAVGAARCQGLLKSTQSAVYESAPLRAFQLTAVQQLQERWKRETAFSDGANTVIFAMALDPRGKEDGCAAALQLHCVTSTNTTATKSTPLVAPQLDSLLGSDDEEEDRAGEAEDVHTQVRNEVVTHFEEKSLAKEENPLSWWKANNERYPMLARLAKSYLCIPATSTPSEPLFSAAGNIASKKRASLSQEHVDMLTFCVSVRVCEKFC
ncbi:hypothetical protein E1301_Tti020347 [Triplophysa tibetana]|uniref:HAT C-terminal dimerisation domain-containing protein n=1 Tax=Triplophysa tibetana TaxID=1572043 RepID=A0A5A9PI59_9TELE|nr:hypothetical protein E1301_Tti020347 [Triplophysa tibetana]